MPNAIPTLTSLRNAKAQRKGGCGYSPLPCSFTKQPDRSLGGRRQLREGGFRRTLRLRRALGEDHLVPARRDLPDASVHGTRTGRDQRADDHVLLQAVKRIDLAVDRRLGEDAGGLLERGGRD